MADGKQGPPPAYQQGPMPNTPYYPPPAGVTTYSAPGVNVTHAPGVTVANVQPAPAGVIILGGRLNTPFPMAMQCSSCHNQIVTETEFIDGAMVYIAAGVLCIIGCWLGCCLIPFCVNEAKDVKHTCPNCHAILGYYKRM